MTHRQPSTGDVHVGTRPACVMFTDIQGSVGHWEALGPAFQGALQQHNDIVRDCGGAHAGEECAFLGDGFLYLFDHPSDAIRCSAAIQERMAHAQWPEGVGSVSVRIGIHAGHLHWSEGHCVGEAVNLASRVMAAAYGGQTLVSEDAVDLARGELGDEVRLVEVGLHRLRDVLRPVRLFLALSPDREVPDYIPVRALDVMPTNLPAELDEFVGRQADLDNIRELLHQKGVRLLTLVGPGGVGKTRLMTRVGLRELDHFADGVWFVDLSELETAEQVPGAIAAALRMPARGNAGEAEAALALSLANKRLLLLLDNFEQVIDAGALPVRLLRACPGLVCMVTSRERLHSTGERVLEVQPLASPDEATPLECQIATDGMRLLCARAADARWGEAVDEEDIPVAGAICRQLSGLPLAIELAAARLAQMTFSELLESLRQSLGPLETEVRGAPERHRSMHAVVDWSYRLLPEPERRALQQVAVFRGGFFVPAAVAVADGVQDVPTALYGLRDKSLLQTEAWHERTRYSMLAPVRAYALERLGPRASECEARVGRYLCELAAGLAIGEAVLDLQLAEAEAENMRLALAWARQAGEGRLLAAAMCKIWPLFNLLGAPDEGLAWLREAVAGSRADPDTRVHRQLLVALAVCLKLALDYDGAWEALDRCETLCQQAEDDDRTAEMWLVLERGALLYEMGRRDEARQAFVRSLATYEEAQQPRWVAESLRFLSRIACDESDFATAEELLDRALSLEDPCDQAWGAGNSLHNLGHVRLLRGNTVGAKAAFAQSVKLCREVGDRPGLADRLADLARVSVASGDGQGAQAACREAIAVARRYAPGLVPGIAAIMECP